MKDDQTVRGESEQANGVGDEDAKRDMEEDEGGLTQKPTAESYDDDEKEDETAAKDTTERAILFVFDPASTATHLTKERLSKQLMGKPSHLKCSPQTPSTTQSRRFRA
jgi:hypothetical protein